MKTPDFKMETHKSRESLNIPLIELGLVISRIAPSRDEKSQLVVNQEAIYAKPIPDN